MNGTGSVSRTLEFAAGPLEVAALLALGALAALQVLRWRRSESATPSRALGIAVTALRLGSLGAILFLLARPALRTVAVEPAHAPLVILADHSASVDDRERARLDEAVRTLESRTRDSRAVRVRPFHGDVLETIEESAAATTREGELVVVTDGRTDGAPREPATPATASPTVHAILVRDDGPRLALAGLDVPRYALHGDPIPVGVTRIARGLAGREIAVEARIHDRTAAVHSTVAVGDADEQTLALSLPAPAPGRHVVTVEASSPGALPVRASLEIEVLDRPLEVLYLEGEPRWTYRFLTGALLRDPAIELDALLASADGAFPQESSEGRERLRRFPAGEALRRYDIVLFGDVDPRRFGVRAAAELASFVEESGGGLLVLAGMHATPGALAGTELEPVLPARLEAGAADGFRIVDPFRMELTRAGARSPALHLIDDPEENRAFLEGRSEPAAARPDPFTGHAALGPPRAGAVVLARHADTGDALLLEQRFGRGRVMVVGLDELWRWRAGVEDRYFHRFFGQAIRGLADLARRVARERGDLRPSKIDARPGDTVHFTFLGEEPPEAIRVAGPDGVDLRIPMVGGRASFVPRRPGSYGARVEGGDARASLRVAHGPAELRATPDTRALGEHVERSGGVLVTERDLDTVLERLGGEHVERRTDRGRAPLAAHPGVLAALVVLLCAEWAVRRIARLA